MSHLSHCRIHFWDKNFLASLSHSVASVSHRQCDTFPFIKPSLSEDYRGGPVKSYQNYRDYGVLFPKRFGANRRISEPPAIQLLTREEVISGKHHNLIYVITENGELRIASNFLPNLHKDIYYSETEGRFITEISDFLGHANLGHSKPVLGAGELAPYKRVDKGITNFYVDVNDWSGCYHPQSKSLAKLVKNVFEKDGYKIDTLDIRYNPRFPSSQLLPDKFNWGISVDGKTFLWVGKNVLSGTQFLGQKAMEGGRYIWQSGKDLILKTPLKSVQNYKDYGVPFPKKFGAERLGVVSDSPAVQLLTHAEVTSGRQPHLIYVITENGELKIINNITKPFEITYYSQLRGRLITEITDFVGHANLGHSKRVLGAGEIRWADHNGYIYPIKMKIGC